MDLLSQARTLAAQGRFAQAADTFEALPQVRLDPSATVEKAWVLEMTGRLDSAKELVSQTLRSRSLPDRTRAHGEYVLSRIAASRGLPDEELRHLNKAIGLAERAEDLPCVVWTQLRMIALRSNQEGPESCAGLMGAARRNVVCSGSPTLTAALHLIVADVDGKRGLLSKSQRHVRLAQSLLERWDNVWLRAWSENTLLALGILQCDFHSARDHGALALEASRASGVAVILRSVHGNLGQLSLRMGEFDVALKYLDQALGWAEKGSDHYIGILDTIARVELAKGHAHDCERLLAEALAAKSISPDESGYIRRHCLLTRGEALARLGNSSESIRCFEKAMESAGRSGDLLLMESARLLLAEAAGEARPTPTCSSFEPLRPPALGLTPEVTALYERAVASQLRASGNSDSARLHKDRAMRIYRAIGDVPGMLDTDRRWPPAVPRTETSALTTGVLLQNAAAVLMHAGRPELVAAGLIAILKDLPCVTGATAVSLAPDGTTDTLDSFGTLDAAPASRTLALGTARGRALELRIGLLADLESAATVNSVAFIVSAVQELERGRLEREERLTLWPVDELPAEDDDSVVTGKMHDLMVFARKIAQTSVSVLVTGESGTGKEVLARAIHRYSPRAKKPFIPFNCTAVPRELLESQLFGYRRGAFTGAERDSPGLIRAAKDGTLFLDEIGELGLDLQPKLLRFLEAGEIHPLGETNPINVNVRIVAATNANLEQLVAEGRFREDLYYRLNVVPLLLPPLRERRDEIQALARNLAAKAAHEFGKGRVIVGDDLIAHLLVYPWPGNVRQLNNELRRMVAIADPDSTLTPDHLPRAMRIETDELLRRARGLEIAIPLDQGLDQTVARIEREMITAALRKHHGRVEAAAKALGISRKGLYLKRRRLGL
jgi:DNA-binding NtrC family response regulator/tetratricopeptide (TPR) repeat protein